MSDSQRPNPPASSFEVPDLELEPVPRLTRQATPARSITPAPLNAPSNAQDQLFGSSFDFGDPGEFEDLEFERSGQPHFQIGGERAPSAARAQPAQPAAEPQPNWPSGRALDAAELRVDPRELSILAGYGDPPESAPLTLAYAYRVFTRQRELKHQLIPIVAECERAQAEREATLAELARAELAARGSGNVDVPEALLERVRKVSDRADQLMVRAEMQRRAITAYDVQRARQGLRLACTAAALLLLLCIFKLIF
jgi:hypothetical protein